MTKLIIVKDIFVDDCVAVRLENPLDPKLHGFLIWLESEGSLVVTKKIVAEYSASLSRGGSSTFIALLSKLQRQGRQVFISSKELKDFKIPPKTSRKLKSNKKDWWHLKAVIISPRKIALSFDNNFISDVNGYPGCSANASSDIAQLNYK